MLQLAGYGYRNIDAFDICPKMLDIAKEKGVYQNIIVGKLGEHIQIPNGEYWVAEELINKTITKGNISV